MVTTGSVVRSMLDALPLVMPESESECLKPAYNIAGSTSAQAEDVHLVTLAVLSATPAVSMSAHPVCDV